MPAWIQIAVEAAELAGGVVQHKRREAFKYPGI